MEQDKQFIATMITAIVAVGLITISTTTRAAAAVTSTTVSSSTVAPTGSSQDLEKCFGVVKAGQNDCDTDNGQCAPSMIDASPNEWIYLPKGVCDRLVGGMSAPTAIPGNSSTSKSTTTTTTTTNLQPGNSTPNAPAGSGSTGGFDDGMNAPNTPYVNDY